MKRAPLLNLFYGFEALEKPARRQLNNFWGPDRAMRVMPRCVREGGRVEKMRRAAFTAVLEERCGVLVGGATEAPRV